MSQDTLSHMGFHLVSHKTPSLRDAQGVWVDVSVIQPDDHKHPQLVFKLTRDILSLLNWEISDRVKIMSKPGSTQVALVKASAKELNTFAISAQGTSVANAKSSGRGGIVKVGWRNGLCESPKARGTYASQSAVFQESLVVSLPPSMFA